jgi:hypothetical protein
MAATLTDAGTCRYCAQPLRVMTLLDDNDQPSDRYLGRDANGVLDGICWPTARSSATATSAAAPARTPPTPAGTAAPAAATASSQTTSPPDQHDQRPIPTTTAPGAPP